MITWRRYWAYTKYVLRHKYFVFKAGMVMDNPPVWRLLVHDMSKFSPAEFFPYAETFYDEEGNSRYKKSDRFDAAWLHHIHNNPHHPEHWVLRKRRGKEEIIQIPWAYMKEMVADWAGAGRAISGKWEVWDWFEKNVDALPINIMNRLDAEHLISDLHFAMDKEGWLHAIEDGKYCN